MAQSKCSNYILKWRNPRGELTSNLSDYTNPEGDVGRSTGAVPTAEATCPPTKVQTLRFNQAKNVLEHDTILDNYLHNLKNFRMSQIGLQNVVHTDSAQGYVVYNNTINTNVIPNIIYTDISINSIKIGDIVTTTNHGLRNSQFKNRIIKSIDVEIFGAGGCGGNGGYGSSFNEQGGGGAGGAGGYAKFTIGGVDYNNHGTDLFDLTIEFSKGKGGDCNNSRNGHLPPLEKSDQWENEGTGDAGEEFIVTIKDSINNSFTLTIPGGKSGEGGVSLWSGTPPTDAPSPCPNPYPWLFNDDAKSSGGKGGEGGQFTGDYKSLSINNEDESTGVFITNIYNSITTMPGKDGMDGKSIDSTQERIVNSLNQGGEDKYVRQPYTHQNGGGGLETLSNNNILNNTKYSKLYVLNLIASTPVSSNKYRNGDILSHIFNYGGQGGTGNHYNGTYQSYPSISRRQNNNNVKDINIGKNGGNAVIVCKTNLYSRSEMLEKFHIQLVGA